ncbi:MAG: helix-turn-helix domain-containing protein [Eggerthellaceae bacterium]|nr:helix-turn-helix domain-containing protein [Eggerthellaceae bacterium]
MEKVSFGEILKNTRERKGLDLNATARRLRIRPDILQAIENSDFASMPPRGYARNMVNGYARYLGLNPTEITGMYLDELYAYQVEYETSRMRPTTIDMPSSHNSARLRDREVMRNATRRTYYESDEREAMREERASSLSSSRRRARSSRGEERLYPESRTHQARGTVLPNNTYTNFYSGPSPVGFLQANWRYLVAGLVGLILLVLIISQIASCVRGGSEPEEVATAPVTGVASSENVVIEAERAPTNFTLEYTVEADAVSWIEVYVNEEIQVGEAVEGPVTRSFTSSDSIQFITANPTPVSIKIDGQPVELEADADGIVNMTWHFSDILAKWLADHPGVKAAESSTASSDAESASTEGGAADEGSTTNEGSTTDEGSTTAADATTGDAAAAGDSNEESESNES